MNKIDKMAESEDSRPFSVLKQNATDFKAVFDEDIKTCLHTLDLKITDLLCNPDSMAATASSGAKRLNAHMEFSKAKLDIFSSMKELMTKMEEQWAEHLTEIRDTFIENVEIFLAGTKLEMKEDAPSPAGNRKSLSLKERKKLQSSPTPVSSLYPKLLDTAKSISDDGASPILKPIRKQITVPEVESPGLSRRKNSVRFAEEVCKNVSVESDQTIEMVEEETNDSDVEIVEAPQPVKRRGRPPANPYAANTSTSLRKAIAVKALQNEVLVAAEKSSDSLESPSRSNRGSRKGSASTPSSVKKSQINSLEQMETSSSDSSISGEDITAEKPRGRRGRFQANADEPLTPKSVTKGRRGAKILVTEEAATPGRETPGKRGRRIAASESVPDTKSTETDESFPTKTDNFPHGLDLTEDLEILSPVINLTRSAPRRKTVILQDMSFTPEVSRSKSKRKTIGGDLNLSSGTPSKRLKMSSRASLVPEEMDVGESDHLEGDNTGARGNYTSWIPLSDVGAKVPAEPGVYELKVSQAKKPAYIGSCESLRQKLTLHKLKHNSGHKHLDKFVERNAVNILVRYETMESLASAKGEEKTRVKSFVDLYNTTPAYN